MLIVGSATQELLLRYLCCCYDVFLEPGCSVKICQIHEFGSGGASGHVVLSKYLLRYYPSFISIFQLNVYA